MAQDTIVADSLHVLWVELQYRLKQLLCLLVVISLVHQHAILAKDIGLVWLQLQGLVVQFQSK